MGVFLILEARQPDGTLYCLGLGWFMPPSSMVAVIVRLF
jgi:hypothetical protein